MRRTPDGGEAGAEFILPMRDAIHPDNWDEWEERGFKWASNGTLKAGQSHLDIDLGMYEMFKGEQRFGVGLENVATGDPFDEKTGQPVRRPGEYGIYWRSAEDQ